jgi:hypothetical protein
MVEAFYVLYIVNSSDERTKRQNVRTKNIFLNFIYYYYYLLFLFFCFFIAYLFSVFMPYCVNIMLRMTIMSVQSTYECSLA